MSTFNIFIRLQLRSDLSPSGQRRQNERGSPAGSCWAGTLTVRAHRPWNICLFKERFLFTFNRAVNRLSVHRSRDHRHGDTGFIGPTLCGVRPHCRKYMCEVEMGLLSSKPNLKQEPFSDSSIWLPDSYRLCPRGAVIYGAEREAAPVGWSRLFTDLACVSLAWGMRWAELDEIAGKRKKSRDYNEGISVSFSHLPEISPTAHPVPVKMTPLGV